MMRFPSFPAGATVLLVASFIAGCGGSDDNNDASPDAGDSASVDGALPVGSAPSTDLDGVEKIGIGMGDMDPTTTAVISDDEGAPVDTSTAAVSSRLSALEEQQGDLFEEFQYKTQDLNDAMAAHIAEVAASLAALTARMEKAEAGINEANESLEALDKKITTVAAQKARVALARAAARRDQPTAPFLLTGVESRGGIDYIGVTPRSATGLADIRFMVIGDQYQGWTLSGISERFATFRVRRETVTVPFSSSDPAP
ncbi:hypothetical protein [Alloalcanivorax xenomutans]|uniref:Lipoprotein n=1 Tax=Alloalcanivorax xenomutans TaxID=1094342 RepID=A0A9Q3WA75_9GAMM|nr:hypothetical protein [Alloalcanivorax xenomutans]MAO61076.1 hypothetical protein [Alcanivorax sp.]MBM1145063.1 hypothetical protein [Alcanivorax sp. ZXX171]MAY11561.1 hypothetical protein [Alcanivorax sp.]MBI54038.1 hypothetical protein [Alcanivorax sp.]MCE7511298.1 hypothetical protein [Alloalcanivorax xenomutans]|tara:strand:- start:43195 stop:43962 length:768 start_codon:yes stop_codon:yes gene_type:complete